MGSFDFVKDPLFDVFHKLSGFGAGLCLKTVVWAEGALDLQVFEDFFEKVFFVGGV